MDIVNSVYINNYTIDFIERIEVEIRDGLTTMRFLPRIKSGIIFQTGSSSSYHLTKEEILCHLIGKEGKDSVTLRDAILSSIDKRNLRRRLLKPISMSQLCCIKPKPEKPKPKDTLKPKPEVTSKPKPQVEILKSINLKNWVMWDKLDKDDDAVIVDLYPYYLKVMFRGKFDKVTKPKTFKTSLKVKRSQLTEKVCIFIPNIFCKCDIKK